MESNEAKSSPPLSPSRKTRIEEQRKVCQESPLEKVEAELMEPQELSLASTIESEQAVVAQEECKEPKVQVHHPKEEQQTKDCVEEVK